MLWLWLILLGRYIEFSGLIVSQGNWIVWEIDNVIFNDGIDKLTQQ